MRALILLLLTLISPLSYASDKDKFRGLLIERGMEAFSEVKKNCPSTITPAEDVLKADSNYFRGHTEKSIAWQEISSLWKKVAEMKCSYLDPSEEAVWYADQILKQVTDEEATTLYQFQISKAGKKLFDIEKKVNNEQTYKLTRQLNMVSVAGDQLFFREFNKLMEKYPPPESANIKDSI